MKHLLGLSIPIFLLLFSTCAFGQTEIHSGTLHSQSDVEEFNLIKFHCDVVSQNDNVRLIKTELAKYSPLVTSCDIDVANNKIYIKYRNGIEINYLLGILRRVSIDAYYLNNGVEVHYVKNPADNFKY